MKNTAVAIAIWMALLSPVGKTEAGWSMQQAVVTSAGPGGDLQDLSSVNLTDCCGSVLVAR